jgi:hypothetical protein
MATHRSQLDLKMEVVMLTRRLGVILVALSTLALCAFPETPAHAQLSGRPIKS